MTYRKPVHDMLSLVGPFKEDTDFAIERERNQKEAAESLAFANVDIKIRYDKTHQPLPLRKGDRVFLRLHQGYKFTSRKRSTTPGLLTCLNQTYDKLSRSEEHREWSTE